MESLNLQNKLELNFNHLKDILIQSRDNYNKDYFLKVAPSRFKKILNDIRTMNALSNDGFFEENVNYYDYVTITSTDIHDNNGNTFLIIKDKSIDEYYGRCSDCNCIHVSKTRRRWVNGETKVCYYKEMISNNYTTKITKNDSTKRRTSL